MAGTDREEAATQATPAAFTDTSSLSLKQRSSRFLRASLGQLNTSPGRLHPQPQQQQQPSSHGDDSDPTSAATVHSPTTAVKDTIGSAPTSAGLRAIKAKWRLSSPQLTDMPSPLSTSLQTLPHAAPASAGVNQTNSPVATASPQLPRRPSTTLFGGKLPLFGSGTLQRRTSQTSVATPTTPTQATLLHASQSLVGAVSPQSAASWPSRQSMQSLDNVSVRETSEMVKQVDPQTGQKMINQYCMLNELGRGVFGKVKLCVDTETGQQFVCIYDQVVDFECLLI